MAEIGKTVLDTGWLAARSTEIDLSGVQLTTTHPPTGPTSPWMEAVVPGTVLATLVKNKVVPDPFYGLENEAIIDIADSGREYYTFWFFTTFQCKLFLSQQQAVPSSSTAIFAQSGIVSTCLLFSNRNFWIIDSSASDHITSLGTTNLSPDISLSSDLKTKRKVDTGHEVGGLYYFDFDSLTWAL
ncbi:unnamed protein product [Ilex paraguariensis]|uniref:Uncharacterized protein n=1 Tax=Ilex paraguariensis TaxID=185542 RepID=A0ABC8T5J6_9AQUA